MRANGYTTLPVEGASRCAELWTRAGRSMLAPGQELLTRGSRMGVHDAKPLQH